MHLHLRPEHRPCSKTGQPQLPHRQAAAARQRSSRQAWRRRRLHQAYRLWRQLQLPATAVATPAAPLCRRQGQRPPPWAAQLQRPVLLLKKQRAWEVRGRLHSLAAAQAARRLQARHQGQRQWQQGQLRSATAPHLRQPPPQTQNSQPISLPLGLLWVSMHQQCLRFPAGPHAAASMDRRKPAECLPIPAQSPHRAGCTSSWLQATHGRHPGPPG